MSFCSGCGAELPADAQFCPKCGRPANEPAAKARPSGDMSRREMRHAAQWERWASPEWALFNTIFGGLFVILLGTLLYLAASETLPELVTWSNFWAYLLLGLGILLLIRGFLGLVTRRYFETGNIVGGLVLSTIGAVGITISLAGWQQYLWIGVIVAGGIVIILAGIASYLFRRGPVQ